MATARIKFYKRNKSLENGRQQEKEPTLFYEAWCEIRNLYGQELYEALDVRLENAIVFEVRYCRRIKEIKAHAKDFLIEFESDRYDIYPMRRKTPCFSYGDIRRVHRIYASN